MLLIEVICIVCLDVVQAEVQGNLVIAREQTAMSNAWILQGKMNILDDISKIL